MLLAEAFDAVGSREISSSALSFLPPWVIEKAVETERQNCMNVVEETLTRKPGPTPVNCLLTASSRSSLRTAVNGSSASPTRKPRRRKRCTAKRPLYCPKLGHPSNSGYRDAAQVFRGFNRCRRRLPATHVRLPNFQVGDYVLVAEHRKSGVSKLQVKWTE
jgi:hypothetical protein